MLKNFVHFYDLAQRAVDTGDVTWAKVSCISSLLAAEADESLQIRDSASDAIFQLSQMKFESPNTQSEEDINGKFDKIYNDIGETFRRMQE